MTESIECAVIGAGVVGLAVARELARSGLETIILERETVIGSGTSSRNSEVIHAGIYYPANSLKAELCVQGKRLLYSYCESRGIEHRACGKLIVATSDEQISKLKLLINNASASGVHDLAMLSQEQTEDLEPEIACLASIHSPSTGIVDSHGLMLSLQGDFESAGGVIAFGSAVESGQSTAHGIVLRIAGAEQFELNARRVVNCAGLAANAIARRLDGVDPQLVPPLYFAKGNYFNLNVPSPFKRLIYPAPQTAGVGIHLTLDLGGNARFGPDVEWIDEPHYNVDPRRSLTFYRAIRKYWPALPDESLSPAYAGVRPKLQAPDKPATDFLIQTHRTHGVAGLVNLFGIESPGLTASMAIATRVESLLRDPMP